jgi:hypothetical protein
MSQTGFHKAPSLPLEHAAASGSAPTPMPTPPPAAPAPEPASGLRLAASARPHEAPASPGAGGETPAQPAVGGLQLQRPQPTAGVAIQPPPAPAAEASAAVSSPGQLMGTPEAPARQQPRRVPASRSFPTTPAAQEPRATPRKGGGRGALVAGAIVVASVGIGAVLGGILLKFL